MNIFAKKAPIGRFYYFTGIITWKRYLLESMEPTACLPISKVPLKGPLCFKLCSFMKGFRFSRIRAWVMP